MLISFLILFKSQIPWPIAISNIQTVITNLDKMNIQPSEHPNQQKKDKITKKS